jgi:hypothetical protein
MSAPPHLSLALLSIPQSDIPTPRTPSQVRGMEWHNANPKNLVTITHYKMKVIRTKKPRPMLKLTWGDPSGMQTMPAGEYIQTGRGVYAVKLASGAPSDKHAYSKR